jgi:hypothetical protein
LQLAQKIGLLTGMDFFRHRPDLDRDITVTELTTILIRCRKNV